MTPPTTGALLPGPEGSARSALLPAHMPTIVATSRCTAVAKVSNAMAWNVGWDGWMGGWMVGVGWRDVLMGIGKWRRC